jgi:hypothetical protein
VDSVFAIYNAPCVMGIEDEVVKARMSSLSVANLKDTTTVFGPRSLSWSAWNGHQTVVKLLLELAGWYQLKGRIRPDAVVMGCCEGSERLLSCFLPSTRLMSSPRGGS